MTIDDYLLPAEGIAWPEVLAAWQWLLPPEFSIWIANRFGDLILVLADGSVCLLDVGAGALQPIAASRDEFCTLIDDEENAHNWLMLPLVDELVAAGILLAPGQCYGFVTPPALGGQYEIANVRPIAAADYLGAQGAIHEQMRDLPDGAQVRLEIRES